MSRHLPWRPHRGRYLKAHEAAALVEACETARAMNRNLVGEGYTLNPITRPYLHGDGGRVTLRFVWRRRADGGCVTLSARMAIEIDRRAG